MKVTTVSASVRFSGALGDSRFKTIELSAEATLDGKETWTEAQARLYHQLGFQLKALWANGTGNKAHESAQDGSESHGEAIAIAEPTQICQEHQTEFKRYIRGSAVWFAHKTQDGKWCREK